MDGYIDPYIYVYTYIYIYTYIWMIYHLYMNWYIILYIYIYGYSYIYIYHQFQMDLQSGLQRIWQWERRQFSWGKWIAQNQIILVPPTWRGFPAAPVGQSPSRPTSPALMQSAHAQSAFLLPYHARSSRGCT